MDDEEIKGRFRVFVEHGVAAAVAAGESHEHRTPQCDTDYDGIFTRLAEFLPAATALEELAIFQQHYGSAEASRFTLALLYGYFDSAGARFDSGAFDAAWASYWKEVNEPHWRYLTICNLSNFTQSIPEVAVTQAVDLGDGVSVRARTSTWVTSIDETLWGPLSRDWEDGSTSRFLLICESRVPKAPDNVVLDAPLALQQKHDRAVLGLRLAANGDVRHGRVFRARPAAIRLFDGQSFSGWSNHNIGPLYDLDPATLARFQELYGLLSRAEELYGLLPGAEPRLTKGWMPLATALRRFNGLFERGLGQREDRVLDAITAIEALLGDKSETTFKVTSRVAALLEDDDDKRVALFESMKLYYDTRSCLVHGADLKEKHLDVIQEHRGLLDLTRRLLVGFLKLSATGTYARVSMLKDEIDKILLHAAKRQDLRTRMGL